MFILQKNCCVSLKCSGLAWWKGGNPRRPIYKDIQYIHTQHKAVFTLRDVSAVPLISTRWQTGSLYGRQEVMSGTDRKFRVRGESGRSSEETLLEVAAEEVTRSYFLFTPSNPVMSVLFLHSHCDVFYLQQMMIHTYIVWKCRISPYITMRELMVCTTRGVIDVSKCRLQTLYGGGIKW